MNRMFMWITIKKKSLKKSKTSAKKYLQLAYPIDESYHAKIYNPTINKYINKDEPH